VNSGGWSLRYGAWALVAGASEGTGRAFALDLARRGLPSVLVARREGPLRELAEQIRRDTGVECVTASIDLSLPDAFERIVAATGDREIGLYISNAGADPNGSCFHDRDVGCWQELISRNLVTTVQCCHHFGKLMRERKRGGLLLVGSGASSGGARNMAVYSGAKAFDLRFSESLWAELRPSGVDVLCVVLNTTDTPALQKLLDEKGRKKPRMIALPDKVAAAALDHIDKGPVFHPGQLLGLRAAWARQRIRLFSYMSGKMIFGGS
jgi:short-subunit dehydrogenase